MRALHALAGIAAVVAVATVLDTTTARAGCSVFSRHPCLPTVCSVFRRGPCIPEIDYPLGQDLRLTIESAAVIEVISGDLWQKPVRTVLNVVIEPKSA